MEPRAIKNLFKLALVVAVAALFAHFWTTPPERMLGDRIEPDAQAPEADSFMRDSTTSRFDDNGELTYYLVAERTDFFLSDNRYELRQPEVEMVAEDGARHRGRANHGTVLGGGEEIRLDGDVVIWEHEPQDSGYELHTSLLWLYPERKYAETDRPVRLLSGQSTTDGIGLRAYLNEQRFEILNDVKSIHRPL